MQYYVTQNSDDVGDRLRTGMDTNSGTNEGNYTSREQLLEDDAKGDKISA